MSKAHTLSKAQGTTYASLDNKSKRIRYLLSLGWTRSEIKNKMKILYQHVRNVERASVDAGSLIQTEKGFKLKK